MFLPHGLHSFVGLTLELAPPSPICPQKRQKNFALLKQAR